MKLVYICSPLRGDLEGNTKKAIEYCSHAESQGVIPLAPHTIFTQFLNDTIPEQRQKGLKMGLELLKRCDELWVCGNVISEGMKDEIEEARQSHIPTRYIKESDLIQNQRPPDMEEKIQDIQQKYGSICIARRVEDGLVTSVVMPEEAKKHIQPEELQEIENYIVKESNKLFEQEPVQEETEDFELSQ